MGKITVETCEIEGLKVVTPVVHGDARGYFFESYHYEDYKAAGIEPAVYGDARGYFMETYNYNDFAAAGIDCQFVQDNQSASKKGVLRGLHFQIEHPQAKLVRVIRGEVFDVAVDLREGSATYGKWHGVVLSEENKKQFFVPEGFAHGFLVLSDYAEFCYKCSDFYHPGDEGGIAYNDPAIGIEWPIPAGMEITLSERDTKWGSITEWKQMR